MDNLGFFELDELAMNICEYSSFCNFIYTMFREDGYREVQYMKF